MTGVANVESDMRIEFDFISSLILFRSSIYPFYLKLKENLLAHGALGVALSGAGPSVLCVLGEDQPMENIRIATQEVLGFNRIPFDVIESGVCGGAIIAR